MNLPVPETRSLTTPDGVQILLTRLRGGSKGPVLLVHGLSVSSEMFTLPEVDQSFASFLIEHGYDVWLLDWRASIKLPLVQFSLDDAAINDHPTAVGAVLAETGADSLQAVVHCMGSTSFFISRSLGLLPDVRSIVSSQVSLHARVPAVTEAKAMLHVPEALDDLGFAALSPDRDPVHPVFQSLWGRALDLIHHECSSTECHRLSFMFGLLYQHANLKPETHARLNQLFGPCNMTMFRHAAQLARHGTLRRYDHGTDENLRRYGQPEPPTALVPEQFKLPITLVSGDANRTFLPESTQLTYDWLVAHNGPSGYSRKLVPGYGHLDAWLGVHGSRDAYPMILESLEQ
jgi:pimeloyl-ACP methyl ester carboxylesterase